MRAHHSRTAPHFVPPSFSVPETVAQLQGIWENKELPQMTRHEAFKFLANVPPSERDKAWQLQAEMFILEIVSPTQKNWNQKVSLP